MSSKNRENPFAGPPASSPMYTAIPVPGICEVCWTELRNPVPPHIGRPITAGFYSIRPREFFVCEEHAALAGM